MNCKPLLTSVLVLDDMDYESMQPSFEHPVSATHLVLRGKAVELHCYTHDLREPYQRKTFSSLDAYFGEYLIDNACLEHRGEVFMLPDVVTASIAAHDRDRPVEDRVQLINAWTNLVATKQRLQRGYYERTMGEFMAGMRYRVGRCLMRM